MSVLIRGMEMPQKCGQCKLYHVEYPMYCMAVEGHRTVGAPYGMPRPDWCPLTEAKEFHGDLIEREEAIKAYEEQKADDGIKVGDEVRILGTDNKFFVVGYEDDCICGFTSGGKTCRVQPVFAQKTGRHINLDSVLEEIKE